MDERSQHVNKWQSSIKGLILRLITKCLHFPLKHKLGIYKIQLSCKDEKRTRIKVGTGIKESFSVLPSKVPDDWISEAYSIHFHLERHREVLKVASYLIH